MSRKFVLTNEQKEKISNRLRSVIDEYGYKTFKDFAVEYGISPQTLQNWIKDGNINIAFLIAFCEDFNINIGWILMGSPYPKYQKPTAK
jgi:transcriptional regulator with XRE-family HTH domain